MLAQDIRTQDNREANTLLNPNKGMATTMLREFTQINHVVSHGSKVDKNHQEFIDEAYNIVGIIGIYNGLKDGGTQGFCSTMV